MRELDLYGVLLPPILAWALIAFVLRALLRRLLGRLGFYRFVAHPALFDMALLVIMLGGVAALSIRLSLT
jgi:protein AaeX